LAFEYPREVIFCLASSLFNFFTFYKFLRSITSKTRVQAFATGEGVPDQPGGMSVPPMSFCVVGRSFSQYLIIWELEIFWGDQGVFRRFVGDRRSREMVR
jgi:hypothetical protein